MKFFLDTANIAEIEEAASWGVLSGVTTNPTLYAREGGKLADFHNHLKRICDIVDGPVSGETVGLKRDEIVREGEELTAVEAASEGEAKTLLQGAATLAWAATAEGIPNGSYLADCQVADAAAHATDPSEVDRLWTWSEHEVGLTFPA